MRRIDIPLWFMWLLLANSLLLTIISTDRLRAQVISHYKTIACDEVIGYPDSIENGIYIQGGLVCEVFVREGAYQSVINSGKVMPEERL